MCRFKSFIVTQNEVLHDLDSDSHEDIIEANKLKDDWQDPQIVRVESKRGLMHITKVLCF